MSQSVPDRKSPEWAKWAAEHPLHKAVIGQPSKGDIQRRVDQMVDWISQGLPRRMRLRHAAEHWGISERRCDELIKAANDQIRRTWEIERPNFMAEQLDRLEALYLLAVERNQLNVAQGCLNAMQRMTGVDGTPSVTYRAHHS
ncbi:hypothetical protein MITS9509_03509 [Synechococcus sp. MIT S9509]|nr:hypothetical protein MITS9509_03509 [Synechococcus sp. MIT S9509]